MATIYNGTQLTGVVYCGVNCTEVFYNSVDVFDSEETWTPSWTLSGSGWTNTTWGSWGVGRDEGTTLVGIAETTKDIGSHTKLRFTPNSYGWRTAQTGGQIRIYINGSLKYTQEAGITKTVPVEIDLTGYSGTVTIRVELQAVWGYSDMYNETTLVLHD